MQWNNSKLSDCHAEMEHTSPQTYRRTIDTLPQMCTHRRATLILQKHSDDLASVLEKYHKHWATLMLMF